jgi:ferritin
MKKSKSKAEPSRREKFLNSAAGQEYLAERERGEPLQKWQRDAIAAKTVLEHRQAITDSITALRLIAEYQGDKEAVMALVECGV